MTDIAALVLDRESRARVHETLGSVARVRFCETCEELYELVRAERMATVIVELRDRHGELTAPTIRRLRAGFPLAPVIAYCTRARPAADDILAAAQAGINGLVLRGLDDVGVALRSTVAAAEDDCTARRAMEELERLVPASARPILEYCLVQARQGMTVEELARAIGLHRKTLACRLGQAALPAPRELIGWCRLLLAGRLLEDVARPVEQIALALNFPSATSFRNMLKRYTGLQPSEVRENGGFACVLHAFRCVIAPRSAPVASDSRP